MKRIKFRMWLKNTSEMDYDLRILYNHEFLETQDHVLMQYTGLVDKNGREIYEGDIIHHFEPNRDRSGGLIDYDDAYEVVRWNKVTGGFDLLMDVLIQPTVCGNIYENPELLEGN